MCYVDRASAKRSRSLREYEDLRQAAASPPDRERDARARRLPLHRQLPAAVAHVVEADGELIDRVVERRHGHRGARRVELGVVAVSAPDLRLLLGVVNVLSR